MELNNLQGPFQEVPVKDMLEFGKLYEEKHGKQLHKVWNDALNNLKKGLVAGGLEKSYTSSFHVVYLLSKEIQAANNIQLQILQAQEITLQQLVSGGTPELKAMIEGIVLKKLEELHPSKVENEEQQNRTKIMSDVVKIEKEISESLGKFKSLEEKRSILENGLQRISQKLRDYKSDTPTEEALIRLLGLANEL